MHTKHKRRFEVITHLHQFLYNHQEISKHTFSRVQFVDKYFLTGLIPNFILIRARMILPSISLIFEQCVFREDKTSILNLPRSWGIIRFSAAFLEFWELMLFADCVCLEQVYQTQKSDPQAKGLSY